MPATITIEISEENELSIKGDMSQATEQEKEATKDMLAAYLVSINADSENTEIVGYKTNDECDASKATKH